MADQFDERYEDEGGSRRSGGRSTPEWEERLPLRKDIARRRRSVRDEPDVYAREDIISFRGVRTPDYTWPPLQVGPHGCKAPQGNRRSDESIFEDACGRLSEHGWLDASHIVLRVENGEVTLEGTVENRRAKRLAEELVAAVHGVWDVHNRLHVPRAAEPPQSGIE